MPPIFLRAPLRHLLSRHTLIPSDGDESGVSTELALGSLGEDASALGAMGLALRQIGGSGDLG